MSDRQLDGLRKKYRDAVAAAHFEDDNEFVVERWTGFVDQWASGSEFVRARLRR